jgi:hypothetical protein
MFRKEMRLHIRNRTGNGEGGSGGGGRAGTFDAWLISFFPAIPPIKFSSNPAWKFFIAIMIVIENWIRIDRTLIEKSLPDPD